MCKSLASPVRWPALILCSLMAPAVGLAQSPVPPAGGAPRVAPPAPAVSAPVSPAEDPNAIRVLLSPDVETTLVSQTVGQISQLQAQLGARVTKGATIVRFDCREAQAENGSARETLTVKQDLRKLNAAGDMEVSLAASEVEKTQAAVEVSRAQLAHCTVAAPFTGRIVRVHVKPFQGVNVVRRCSRW